MGLGRRSAAPSEVASSLFVSPKTVHTHRQHIMEKLGLRTTTELIRFAPVERKPGSEDQFAAMKIDRPKPVR